MKWWHWLIVGVVGFGVVMGILVGVGVFKTGEYIEAAELTILDSDMSYEWLGYPPEQWPVVTGHAKNTGTRDLNWAEVTVKWYDTEGSLIGTSSDYTDELAVGEVWRFRCETYIFSGVDDPTEIVSYEVVVGSVW
jgi:hypothetical protein